MSKIRSILAFVALMLCGGAWAATAGATAYTGDYAKWNWTTIYSWRGNHTNFESGQIAKLNADLTDGAAENVSWTQWCAAKSLVNPQFVLRLDKGDYAANRKAIYATYSPWNIGGLIVETGATGYTLERGGNSPNNRGLVIGDMDGAHEAYVEIKEDFSINRSSTESTKTYHNGFVGTVNVTVAENKTFTFGDSSHNGSDHEIYIRENGALKMHGAGKMTVYPSLTATGSVTLDFSDLSPERTEAFINGSLTVNEATQLILPEGITEEKPLKLCSGTLTGLSSGIRSVVINGQSVLADLTITDKEITSVVIQEQMPDVAFKFTGNATGGTINNTSWVTSWDGEGGDAAKKMIGPDGKGVVPMTFHVDDSTKWHPYKDGMTAKDAFTLAAYVNTELSQPTANKYQVIWCMGWNNAEKTALVKASDGSIQLVHSGTDSQITKSVTIDAAVITPGYHLFTATFSTTAGLSLTIDNNTLAKQSDSTATTKAGDGIQIGGVLGNCQGVFELGQNIGIAALVAYDQVLSDNQIKAIALDYPTSKAITVDVNPTDNKELLIPSMTVASDKMLGVTHGTLTIPKGASVETPRFKIQNTSSNSNRTTVNIAGKLTMTAENADKNVWGNDGKGLLFGHWHGQGTYNITGTIDASKTYLETVYTAEMQTINLDGGTITVKSVYAAKDDNTTFNLKNGGRLNMTATDEVNVPFTNVNDENTISVANNQTISKPLTLTAGTLNLDVADTKTLTISGAISGEGEIVKKGSGTLHITGSSSSTIVFNGDGMLTSTSDSLKVITRVSGKGIEVTTQDGVSTYSLFDAAAYVGDKYYATLEEAIAHANGSTITLCQEIESVPEGWSYVKSDVINMIRPIGNIYYVENYFNNGTGNKPTLKTADGVETSYVEGDTIVIRDTTGGQVGCGDSLYFAPTSFPTIKVERDITFYSGTGDASLGGSTITIADGKTLTFNEGAADRGVALGSVTFNKVGDSGTGKVSLAHDVAASSIAGTATIEIGSDVTLTPAAMTSAVSGAGKIKFAGFAPIKDATVLKTSLQDSEHWTGTLVITQPTTGQIGASDNTVDGSNKTLLNNYGNVKSQIEFLNCTYQSGNNNYFGKSYVDGGAGDVVVQPEIVVTGAFKLNNGYSQTNKPSDLNNYTIFRKLSGTGTITSTYASQLFVILDGSDFTGAINTTHKKFIFGSIDANDRTADGQPAAGAVVIKEGNSVTIGADQNWSASGGVTVDGTLVLGAAATATTKAYSIALKGTGTISAKATSATTQMKYVLSNHANFTGSITTEVGAHVMLAPVNTTTTSLGFSNCGFISIQSGSATIGDGETWTGGVKNGNGGAYMAANTTLNVGGAASIVGKLYALNSTIAFANWNSSLTISGNFQADGAGTRIAISLPNEALDEVKTLISWTGKVNVSGETFTCAHLPEGYELSVEDTCLKLVAQTAYTVTINGETTGYPTIEAAIEAAAAADGAVITLADSSAAAPAGFTKLEGGVLKACDYVVISPNAYVSDWQTYVTARQEMPAAEGLVLGVKNATEIYTAYPYASTNDNGDPRNAAESIHKWIGIMQKLGTKYFVLGGVWMDAQSLNADGEQETWGSVDHMKTGETISLETAIPGVIAYPVVARGELGAVARNYPSDLYYACHFVEDGKKYVWDSNVDSMYLGPEECLDYRNYIPSCVVSRMDLVPSKYVNKTYRELIASYLEKLRKGESVDFGGNGKYVTYVNYCLGYDDDTGLPDVYGVMRDRLYSIVNTRTANELYLAPYNKKHPELKPGMVDRAMNEDWELSMPFGHGIAEICAYIEDNCYGQATGITKFFMANIPCYTGTVTTFDKTDGAVPAIAQIALSNPNGGSLVSINNTCMGQAATSGLAKRYEGISDEMLDYALDSYVSGSTAGEAWMTAIATYANKVLSSTTELAKRTFDSNDPNAKGYDKVSYVISAVVEEMLFGDPLVAINERDVYVEDNNFTTFYTTKDKTQTTTLRQTDRIVFDKAAFDPQYSVTLDSDKLTGHRIYFAPSASDDKVTWNTNADIPEGQQILIGANTTLALCGNRNVNDGVIFSGEGTLTRSMTEDYSVNIKGLVQAYCTVVKPQENTILFVLATKDSVLKVKETLDEGTVGNTPGISAMCNDFGDAGATYTATVEGDAPGSMTTVVVPEGATKLCLLPSQTADLSAITANQAFIDSVKVQVPSLWNGGMLDLTSYFTKTVKNNILSLQLMDTAKPAETDMTVSMPGGKDEGKIMVTVQNPIPGLCYSIVAADSADGFGVEMNLDESDRTQVMPWGSNIPPAPLTYTYDPAKKVQYFKVRVSPSTNYGKGK